MTQEEKAKRYDEAIEKAKEYFNSPRTCFDIEQLCNIFPELKESEDERIRKAIFLFVEAYGAHANYEATQEEMLAWLEKQGEQKTIDEIAKEVCKDKASATAFLKLTGIMNEKGELAEQYRQGEQKPEEVDNLHNYLYGEQKPAWSEEVQEEQVNEEFINALGTMLNDGLPDRYLVSEERIKKSAELLFSIARKQLKNEMQGWSEEDEEALEEVQINFEINKGKMTPALQECYDRFFDKIKTLNPYLKKEWSEEDKEFINDLIGVFDGQQHQAHSDEEIVKWLKSIRLPYNKEWDENDEEMLRSIIATCELAEQDRDSSPARHLLEMQLNWLKSLKERVQEPKQEWNKEDEKMFKDIVTRLHSHPDVDKTEYDKSYHWLKSLRPQKQWKPSEEQMNAFDAILVYNPPCSDECRNHLITLYNELKKLRGE